MLGAISCAVASENFGKSLCDDATSNYFHFGNEWIVLFHLTRPNHITFHFRVVVDFRDGSAALTASAGACGVYQYVLSQ